MILNLKKYEKKYFGISLFMQHVYICPKACSESWLSNGSSDISSDMTVV